MKKSDWVARLLRVLIALLGAGLGAAAALGIVQAVHLAAPNAVVPLQTLVLGYALFMLAGLLVFALCSRRIMDSCGKIIRHIDSTLDSLTLQQLICRIGGVILGFLIAALLSQILHFMGDSLFTTTLAVILFVLFGSAGYRLGKKRSGEAEKLLRTGIRLHPVRRPKRRRGSRASDLFLLDSSVLIDGRIADVCRLGFLNGTLVIPDFVLDELRHVADSTDAMKRARGRRGLDTIARLQSMKLRIKAGSLSSETSGEVDVKLLQLAHTLKGAIVTGDYNLAKVAQVSAIQVLNLNELANVLRPAVTAGDTLQLTIVKEGKEAGQGVGYMPDGTMVVVEGGRGCLDKTVTVTVTSALQTSAGRMIFAKLA